LSYPSPAAFAAAALAGVLFTGCGAALPPSPSPAVTACIVAPRPDALWSLAQCCARDLGSNHDCRAYSAADRYIILKDNSPRKPNAYLIIPTTRVSGIEDPRIFAPPVAGLWADGWRQAQVYLKEPAAATGLAINSAYARSESQLHIHISCVGWDVARALAEETARIGADPNRPIEIRLGPAGHPYRAIKVTSLTGPNPFALAVAMAGAQPEMAAESMAVIGSAAPGVYFVLETRRAAGNRGNTEELLDQSCRSWPSAAGPDRGGRERARADREQEDGVSALVLH
jgi:CDP-diacylglycerol pyrophosphatase